MFTTLSVSNRKVFLLLAFLVGVLCLGSTRTGFKDSILFQGDSRVIINDTGTGEILLRVDDEDLE
ncbi:unnamed protein product, partial [marine sediment metagenome]